MSEDKRLPASNEPGQIYPQYALPPATAKPILGVGPPDTPTNSTIAADDSLPRSERLLVPRQSSLTCPARTGFENVRSPSQLRRPASSASRQVLVREAQIPPEDLSRTDRLAALLSQALSHKLARSNASGTNGDTQLDYVPVLSPTTDDPSGSSPLSFSSTPSDPQDA